MTVTRTLLTFALAAFVSLFWSCGDADPTGPVEPTALDNDFRETDRVPEVGDEGDGEEQNDDGIIDPSRDEDPDPGEQTGPYCGNGIREGDEECDGDDLLTRHCSSFGYTGRGELVCNEHCFLDAPMCDTGSCGNGVVDDGEQCDGGSIRTSAECTLDCRVYGGLYGEPNDTLEQAIPLEVVPGVETRVTGSIIEGDVDYYVFTTDEALELVANTSDGADYCNFDSVLSLRDGSDSVLVSDDDDGEGTCSAIDSTYDAPANLAEPGAYYLVVAGLSSYSTGDYTLHVNVYRAECGDGRLSTGEECDDHNTVDDDGCDSDCRLDAIDEVEPNNTPDAPDGPHTVTGDSPILFRGEISETGDVDVFAIPMGAGDTFTRLDLLAVGPTCPFDARLALLAPDKTTVLASATSGSSSSSYDYYDYYWWDDTSSGDDGMCASMTASGTSALNDLTAGLHYLVVESSSSSETGPYLLSAVVHEAVCGNGIREGDETCDDANDDADDGCHECALDADLEEEPNDTVDSPTPLGGFTDSGTAAIAGLIEDGDVDYFSISVSDEARISAWTSDGSLGCDMDTVIEFQNASGTQLARDDDGGEGSCSRLDKLDPEMSELDAGNYLIMVQGYSSYSEGMYVLNVTVGYPTCGDGIVEGAEICDDENTANGDGCSNVCSPEGQAETEPNNDHDHAGAAIDLTGDDQVLATGFITIPGDEDFFAVTVADDAKLGARLWNGSGGCAVDSRVSLRSDSVTVIRSGVALSSDEGCWQIGDTVDPYGDGDALSAGTYYLRVAGRSGDTGAYQLVLWADYPSE